MHAYSPDDAGVVFLPDRSTEMCVFDSARLRGSDRRGQPAPAVSNDEILNARIWQALQHAPGFDPAVAMAHIHRDGPPEHVTALLYPNEAWEPAYSGETIFFSEEGREEEGREEGRDESAAE